MARTPTPCDEPTRRRKRKPRGIKTGAVPARATRVKRPALLTAIDKPLLHPECDWFCYLLTTPGSSVPYIGKTNDLDHRLRQHNGELAGGAKRTHRALPLPTDPTAGAKTWTRQLHVAGFPDERAALNFEWRWEYDRRRAAGADRRAGRGALVRALLALRAVLERELPTSVALPYAMYPAGGVAVVCETEDCKKAWSEFGAGAPHVVPYDGLAK